ncbi:hypothetical protein NC653_016169 [Populus alba x Populus x berolinensis]|uniref:Legume lectin domain-containing protein n=1 Tax=Populus alba x Populus x berolinensis TaxID=444605 RepID=A0AAD6QMC6_9ROSI|nr:hypothetical protein NC653_016169 [Populus alba x Populus x berolinensis]
MAKLSISTCLTVLTFMIFHLKMLHAVSSYSFSFGSFDKDPNFESNIALYGDAKVVGNGSSLQLTRPVSSSAGRVMYKQPIKLVEGNPGNLVSFSTYFSFLMSPDNGDGLAFVVVPSGFNATGSKRLEIRLSHSGDIKPIDPLLSHPIDLSKMWNDEKVLIGLTSSNGNSSQTCFLHSWNFKLRRVPHWMHSQPLDPQDFAKHEKPMVVQKKSDCILKMLTAMIFGAACGALGALMVLYLWTIFGNRRPVMPEECSVPPADFEYKKVKVIVDKAIEDGKH